MALLHLDVQSRRPYHGGAEFGQTGAYERLDGVASFAVDPLHAANRAIVDLDKAERDAAGRVLFSADFCLLQPLDAARGKGRLLFDIVNRGSKRANTRFNRAPAPAVPSERIGPGDGFLMTRGWTVAWCGWQWDVVRSPALLGLDAPQALENGRPIQGQVMVEFQPNEACADRLLSDRIHQPYPAADLSEAAAVMRVREWPAGPASVVPRHRWRFARDEGGRPVEDPHRVWLEDGFQPGLVYDITYRTSICPIAGAGLLAVRDAVSFLRYGSAEQGNPSAGRISHSYGFGVSQSGRFLRHFLYLGLNLDEDGRQVFDGVLPHVAGGRRGEFNQRFAQPSRQPSPGFGHLMPFALGEQTDPLSGQTDALLRRQRALGGVPRIIATNTAAEYWRGDGFLLHGGLDASRDLEPPPEARVYLIAGTQHGPGRLPLARFDATEGSHGVYGFNAVDYSPALRAALINLDRWVSDGVEPPPSRVPRLDDGTAVAPAEVIAAFSQFPLAGLPRPDRLRAVPRLDLGPDDAAGIGRYPVEFGTPYPVRVSSVDADGNEVAGVRLPDIAVPLATYTGWNPRDPATGGEGQILDMLGSTLPFPPDAEQRQQSSDPRPAINERYRDREDYLARVRAVAETLAAQRYVLAEDVELLLQLAAERYDAFAHASTPAPADGS